MDFTSTINKHKEQPEISFSAYAKAKHIELGKAVLSKKIVYLDTKFWIIFRDVVLGRNTRKPAVDLYQLCLSLSESGKCIFPLSDSIFLEVMKQTDDITSKESIRLIDKLSSGISLINTRERMNLEIMQYMDEKAGKFTHKCEEMVWTKLTYVLGFVSPNPNFDISTNLVIKKSFFDHMWSISLENFLSVAETERKLLSPKEKSISEELNKMKFAHADDSKSFQQMFLNEIAGIINVVREDFPEIISRMYRRETGKLPTKEELADSKSIQLLANIIYNLFKLRKISTELPTLRIKAGLHAAIRWDKKQKFQENDMYDLRHAASGLPYCDYIFTEKRLAHLVTQSSLAFDKLYKCSVLSSPEAALEALAEIK